MKKIIFSIFAVIIILINFLLIFLGDAFIWAGIVITALVILKKMAPKKIWIALIIITVISIVGTLPRPLVKNETNQIKAYLFDKYGKSTFKIKTKYLYVEGSGKYCGGSWISICLGFKMFNWTNLEAIIIDEKNIEFSLEAKLTRFNKFNNFKDTYIAQTERNTEVNFMNNKLIPILKQYSIFDVKHSTYGWIEVNIIEESVIKDVEEKMWDEIIQKVQYDKYNDPFIIVTYYKNEPYWYNEIENYYLREKQWK